MSAKNVLTNLLDRLWDNYCNRVSYARRYCDLVLAKGGRVVNDHIAYRTLNTPMGDLPVGIEGMSRVITPLGYKPADSYAFTDKHLVARHYEHPDPLLPKIFISQLQVDELPADTAGKIRDAVANAKDLLAGDAASMLDRAETLSPSDADALTDKLYAYITTRPWPAPPKDAVVEINNVSQYAAWTLLHGNSVNHFTAYINEQQVADWSDIDVTVAALREAGVPMKESVEGQPGSKLRQSATQAVDEDCDVVDASGKPAKLRWSYAYYELAERGSVPGPDGKPVRFSGFLGPQATHLFEMTKR
jgi:hypothetical protein